MAGWDRRDWAEQKTTWLYHRSSSSTTLSGSKAEPGAAPTIRYDGTEEPLLNGHSTRRILHFYCAFTPPNTEADTDSALPIYRANSHLSFCGHIFQQECILVGCAPTTTVASQGSLWEGGRSLSKRVSVQRGVSVQLSWGETPPGQNDWQTLL